MALKRKTSIVAILCVLAAIIIGFSCVSLIKNHTDWLRARLEMQNENADDILSFSEWNIFGPINRNAIFPDVPEINDFQNAKEGFSGNFFKYVLTDGVSLVKSTDNLLVAVNDLKALRIRMQSTASVLEGASDNQDYLSKQLDLTSVEKKIIAIKKFLTNDGRVVFLLLNENQINQSGGKILETRIYDVASGKLDLDNEIMPSPEIVSLLSKNNCADMESLALKIKRYYSEKEVAVVAINLSGMRRIVNDFGVIEFPEEKMVVDGDNVKESAFKKKDLLKSVLIVAKERLKGFSMEKSLSFSEGIGKIMDMGSLQVVLPEKDASTASPEINYLSLKPVFTSSESSPLRARVEIDTELFSDGTNETVVSLKRSQPDSLKGSENLFVVVPQSVEIYDGNNENKRTIGLDGLDQGLVVKEFDNIGRVFSFKYKGKMDMLSGKSYRFLYKGQKGTDMPLSVKITVSGGYVFKETGRSEYVYESLDSVEELPIVLTLVRL